jgi:pimeloyl-ACP methyl ester carboxylesterase
MAGDDDPIVPLVNARLLARLIPNAELEIFDCGHLFLLTRLERSVTTLERFLFAHLTGDCRPHRVERWRVG